MRKRPVTIEPGTKVVYRGEVYTVIHRAGVVYTGSFYYLTKDGGSQNPTKGPINLVRPYNVVDYMKGLK